MASALRQPRIARLIAAALSFAVVFASIVGAAAHAGEHGHHRHHHHDHHHGTGTISPDADHAAHHAPVAGSHIDFQSIADDEPQHAGCLDFTCHGGVAVLGATTPWDVGFWPEAAIFPWRTQALDAVSPARLDRPPKSLV